MADSAIGVVYANEYACRAFNGGVAKCTVYEVKHITDEMLSSIYFNVRDIIELIQEINQENNNETADRYKRIILIENASDLVHNVNIAAGYLSCLLMELNENNDTVILARVPFIDFVDQEINGTEKNSYRNAFEVLLRSSFIDTNAISQFDHSCPMTCITDNAKELITKIIEVSFKQKRH